MQSLLDLYNMREGKRPGSDLLEFYQGNGQAPEPQVIDRATFLPIGQYEDGSLTLAWPGFLKDAYEGAVRSYEQGRQLPRADEDGYYAGTPRAEPLDAFNAASLAPMASIGMRAAGMTTGPTRDAFMAENLMRKFPEEKVISGGAPGHRNDWFPGDRYGDAYWDSSRGLARENEIPRASRMNGMSWDPSTPPMNDLAGGPMTDYDLGALNQAWRNKVVRTGELFANDSRSSLPALVTQGDEDQFSTQDILRQYGLLGP